MQLGYSNSLIGQNRPRGASFVGALDAFEGVKLLAWSTTHRLFSSYSGNLITLRANRTGQPTQAIGYSGAAGALDAASAASFLNGDTGYFTTVNEQANGSNHLIQSSAASQPQYEATGYNSGPCMLFDGSNDGLITTNTVAAQSSWWGYVVCRRIAAGSSPELWALVSYPETASDYRLFEADASSTIGFNNSVGGTVGLGWPTGTNMAFLLKGTSSLTYAKNSAGASITSVKDNTIKGGFKMTVGYRNDSSAYLNGRVVELALFSGQPSASDEAAIWATLNARFGTPIP